MADTPNLLLPWLAASQAQKHVTHNEALRLLDGLVQLAVEDRDLTAPPGAPGDGDCWIVAAGATGDWTGWDDDIAMVSDGAWYRLPARIGWLAWVRDEATLLVRTAAGWTSATPETLALLGINATADETNRLAVSAPATLLSHEGAGHQLKINKAAAGDTASVLFQTGFSGRAEMGTAGTDDFSVKVSADGAAWNTAIGIEAATGVPDLKAGATIDGSLAFARATILGSVAQSGGVPTGGVMERGSNANGEYVRFADGTQICTRNLLLDAVDCTTAAGASYRSASLGNFTYPAAFASVSYTDASLGGSDNIFLRNGALLARLGFFQQSANTEWKGLVLVSTVSAAAAVGELTRFMLVAVGRWF